MEATLMDRVRLLIERSGLTQETFAAVIDLDPTKMSKSLNGKRRFSSLDLAKIAEHSHVTVDWLLNGRDRVAAARVGYEGSSVAAAIEEAHLLAEARDNLVFLGGNQDWPKPPPFVSALWVDQGKELADFALEHLGPPNSRDREDFATAIEQRFGIDVRVMELEPGCDGLAMCGDGSRILLVASSGNPTRQRFTMAHELAHLLCRDDQDVHIDEDVMARTGRRDSEMRANAFAAALLMPEELLREQFTGTALADEAFCRAVMDLMVSPSSLAWRLLNLQLISPRQRQRLGSMRTVDCAAGINRMQEYAAWVENSSQPRLPVRLVQDTLQAYLDGSTTLRPLANLLRVPIDLLRNAVDQAEPADSSEGSEFEP